MLGESLGFISSGMWVLVAFVLFFVVFGKKIFGVVIKAIDAKIEEIRHLVESSLVDKEAAHDLVIQRKHELNEVMTKCHELQESADQLIHDLHLDHEQQIKKLNMDMNEILEQRLSQLKDITHYETRRKLASIYKNVLIKMMVAQHSKEAEKIDLEGIVESLAENKDKIMAS